MKTTPNDVSNQEILQEFHKVSEKMDARTAILETSNQEILKEMRHLHDKIDGVHTETMEAVYELSQHSDERFDRLEGRLGGVEVRLNRVEANMVTKDYLDDKLANQYSDIVRHTKKEIEKALA